ncbi:MAG TPA: RNA polymerase sigma factor [Thermoanaerobaculia bacterium]|nr:RNA polymerase sigma factor [Thermoanaerobaculia bacterium]
MSSTTVPPAAAPLTRRRAAEQPAAEEVNDAGTLRNAIAPLHEAAFCWALRCCDGDRDAAEETVQASYLKVLTGRARFAGRSSVKTWLFAVVRRTAGEQRRRARWRRLALALMAARTAPPPPAPAAEAGLEAAQLRHALAHLPRRQREILHLVFYDDLTIEEAASVAGVSLGTARTHYARGKVALRRLVAERNR